MKSKLAIIIDSASISLLTGLIAFSWCQFYVHMAQISLLVALCVMATSILICWIINKQLLKKRNITKQNKNNINSIFDKLRFCSEDKQIVWLKQSIIPNKKADIYQKFFYFDDSIIYNALLHSNLTPDDLCKIIRDIGLYCQPETIKSITIIGGGFNNDLKNFAKSLNVNIILLDKVNAILKYNLTPDGLPSSVCVVKPVKNYKYFINYAFSPARTKSYLMLGLVLLLSSFFVLYKVYYLIFGTILLTMSIITVLKHLKKKNSLN